MPIRNPIVTEIAAKTYLVNEFGLDVMYVLVGSRRALVLDTGSGFCDFKAIVRRLTELPYDFVLTHGHLDHAGGAGQFGEIYIHPADLAMAKEDNFEMRAEYGEILRKTPGGDPDAWGYSREDVRRWGAFPKVKDLREGMAFDLGGRTVRVYGTPGHTPGSCSLIDDGSRILFSGDAANGNLLLGGGAVSTALRGLLKLKAHQGEFDRNYNGHIGYAGDVTCVSQPDSVLDDCVACCRSLLDGSAETFTYSGFLGGTEICTAARYGAVRITFSPDRLWEPGEERVPF